MNMNGRTNNPTMHSCLQYPINITSFLWVHLFHSGRFLTPSWTTSVRYIACLPQHFSWELISREIISPMACVHTACSHRQYTVLHATSNLLAMMVIDPLCRPSSHCLLWSIEIICNHEYFNISLFLGHGGGTSLSEASPSSIIHSNQYAKV